jgi:hypothetical protein
MGRFMIESRGPCTAMAQTGRKHMMNEEKAAQTEYKIQFRRIVVRTFLLIACAALFLAVGRVLRDWQPDRRAIPLITGDILYYRGTTFGTHHVAPDLPRLVQALPSGFRKPIVRYLRLAPGSGQHITSEPRLVLWLDDTHPFVTNRTAPVSMEWMLGDASGATAGPKVGSVLAPGQPGLVRLEFEAFPRRSRILHLQAFARIMEGPIRPAGSLVVPNLYRNLTTEWGSDPLPLTRTNAGLECTLLALPTGVGSKTQWTREEDATVTLSYDPADSTSELRTTAAFSFRDPTGLDEDWTVANVLMHDATGNELASKSASTSSANGVILFSFNPYLWPEETWRLNVWAKRTAKARFTPEEQFDFLGVPLPAEGQTRLLERVIRRNEREVRLESIDHQSAGRNSQITVTVPNLGEGLYLDLIEVIDDRGRPLSQAGWSMSHDNPGEARFAIHEIPHDAQTIDVRLAVHQGRPFVFQIRPERASTNGWSMRFPADGNGD